MMAKKKTRAQIRKERYQRIVLETGNTSLARQYRDASPARIKEELGINVAKPSRRKEKRIITDKQWSIYSDKKEKGAFPRDVEAYAIMINRQVGADDYNKFGFVYAYKRLVEGKGVRTIDREVVYDPFGGIPIYQDVEVLA